MTSPSPDWVVSGRYFLLTEHHDPRVRAKFLQTGEMPPVPLRAEKHGWGTRGRTWKPARRTVSAKGEGDGGLRHYLDVSSAGACAVPAAHAHTAVTVPRASSQAAPGTPRRPSRNPGWDEGFPGMPQASSPTAPPSAKSSPTASRTRDTSLNANATYLAARARPGRPVTNAAPRSLSAAGNSAGVPV